VERRRGGSGRGAPRSPGRRRRDAHPGAAGLLSVEEGGAGGGGRPDLAVPELEVPRASWKSVLLRKDADAVNLEDRSTTTPCYYHYQERGSSTTRRCSC
jgi:hypothetical protein